RVNPATKFPAESSAVRGNDVVSTPILIVLRLRLRRERHAVAATQPAKERAQEHKAHRIDHCSEADPRAPTFSIDRAHWDIDDGEARALETRQQMVWVAVTRKQAAVIDDPQRAARSGGVAALRIEDVQVAARHPGREREHDVADDAVTRHGGERVAQEAIAL